MIEEQKGMGRNGTWYKGVCDIMEKYEIEDITKAAKKSKWKGIVKKKIRKKTEEGIRIECGKKRKARTVK